MCLINAAESLVALSIGLPRKPRVSGGKRAVRGRKCPNSVDSYRGLCSVV